MAYMIINKHRDNIMKSQLIKKMQEAEKPVEVPKIPKKEPPKPLPDDSPLKPPIKEPPPTLITISSKPSIDAIFKLKGYMPSH